MVAFVFIVTFFKIADGFLYKNGPCPGIPNVSLKNTDLDHVIFQEFLRYPVNTPVQGHFTETCYTFSFDIAHNLLHKNHTRLSSCGGKTPLYMKYRVDLYDQSESGAFRIAQYGVNGADVVNDDLYREPTQIDNHQKQIWLEDYDVRVILKVESEDDDKKWLVLWGCDQINNATNRQSLHVLCNYDCNLHLEAIRELTQEKGVSLDEAELCEEYHQENAATQHFSTVAFWGIALISRTTFL